MKSLEFLKTLKVKANKQLSGMAESARSCHEFADKWRFERHFCHKADWNKSFVYFQNTWLSL